MQNENAASNEPSKIWQNVGKSRTDAVLLLPAADVAAGALAAAAAAAGRDVAKLWASAGADLSTKDTNE